MRCWVTYDNDLNNGNVVVHFDGKKPTARKNPHNHNEDYPNKVYNFPGPFVVICAAQFQKVTGVIIMPGDCWKVDFSGCQVVE